MLRRELQNVVVMRDNINTAIGEMTTAKVPELPVYTQY